MRALSVRWLRAHRAHERARSHHVGLAGHMRETHSLSDEYGEAATASLLEKWIDEAEQRLWLLFE